MASVQDKINAFVVHMRRLWPKYDQDLDQQVNTVDLILEFIQQTFFEAKLHEDHASFEQLESGSIEELVYVEAGVNPNDFESKSHQERIDQ